MKKVSFVSLLAGLLIAPLATAADIVHDASLIASEVINDQVVVTPSFVSDVTLLLTNLSVLAADEAVESVLQHNVHTNLLR